MAAPPKRAGVSVIGLLGVNLWAVALAVPAGLEPPAREGVVVALLAPLVLLTLGLFFAARAPRLTRWTLLALFPLAVGLGMAGLDLGDGGVAEALLVGLSFMAYLAATSSGLERTRPRGPGPPHVDVETQPSPAGHPTSPRAPDPPRRPLEPSAGLRLRRALVHATCVAGALGLAIVAPSWDGDDARAIAFGASADAASVLVAVVGGLLGLLVLGGYLAPATRSERPKGPRGSVARGMVYVLLAAAGGALFHLAKL